MLKKNLKNLSNQYAKIFATSTPFNHIVIDDLFTQEFLHELLENFPSSTEKVWWLYDNPLEKKLAFNEIEKLPVIFHNFFEFMKSKDFINFLEEISGIYGIIADPKLNGGGLHQILRGGKLDIHEDFNIHKELNAFRKLNVILYLNADWKESYGGDLEMWDAKMSQCVKKISPLFGRMVIFRTDQTSNHGHPEPLNCPEDKSRKSLATYYYVPVANEQKVEYRSTNYKKIPGIIEAPEIDELRKLRLIGRIENRTT
jgi:Rps23 Pro-64 3,4-dihydroxylase Tpa1-like proline 4-hydroxylase